MLLTHTRRASVGRTNKLSVFDAMADLDLAVGQEEWNDFADETTAPPRCPTPPPPPSPPPTPPSSLPPSSPSALSVAADAPAAAAGAEPVELPGVASTADGATVAAAIETEGVGGPEPTPLSPEPFIYYGGGENAEVLATAGQPRSSAGEEWPFSSGGKVEAEATAAAAAAVVGGGNEGADAAMSAVVAESEDDDWGDFEDAEVGQGQRLSDQPRDGKATEGRRESDSIPLPEPENSEDAWGGFVDVQVAVGTEAEAEAMAVVAAAGGSAGDRQGGSTPDLAVAEDPATTGVAGIGGGTRAPEVSEVPGVPEVEDPFAAIAPPTPPSRPQLVHNGSGFGETSNPVNGGGKGEEGTEAPQVSTQNLGESLSGTMEGRAGGPVGGTAAAGVPGLPLSLRDLRDVLATRGRLEEAVEVQRRMELPTPSTTHLATPARGKTGVVGFGLGLGVGTGTGTGAGVGFMGKTSDASNVIGEEGHEGRDGGDLDLERWRAATELPPAPTLGQLAEAVSEADAARGEIFRERFVAGRPAVEEEALAGGGAVSLGRAVVRQRAARRAVSLSATLGTSAAVGTAEGEGAGGEGSGLGGADGMDHDVLDIDLGLGASGGRPPPSLPDWASMVAYVARVAREGLDALKEGGSVAGAGSAEAKTGTQALGGGPQRFGGGGGSSVDDGEPGQGSREGDGTNGCVVREVALSARFVAFSRGLREAVRVCRMLQAAAEDGLETVDGFVEMERAWAELRRRAREVASGADGNGGGGGGRCGAADEYPAVFDPEDSFDDNEKEENRSLEESVFSSVLGSRGQGGGDGGGGGDDGVLFGSVKAVREAGVGRAPAGSALCAVCLQPLEVFGGGRSTPDVVEYCGVRYLAAAVNLWVNVLDKPPPGPLPLDSHD